MLRALSLGLSLTLASGAALADMAPFTANGQRVSTREVGGEAQLIVDGRIVDRGANFYTLAFQTTLDGLDVAVVYAETGGASCEQGASIVVGAGALGKWPRVETRDCGPRPVYRRLGELGNQRLAIVVEPQLTEPGQLWTFAPTHGLHRDAVLEFKPKSGTTFDSLRREAAASSSYSFFDNEAFYRAFDATVGQSRSDVLAAVGDPEPGPPIEGRYLVSTGFQSHDAGHRSLIGVDLDAGAVFVANYPPGGKVEVWPSVAAWPRVLRRRLATWAADAIAGR